MDMGNDFVKPFVTFGKWLLFLGLITIIGIQNYQIRNYKQSEKEWVELSKLWREKLDTCMNRNERIYEQLYQFQDIRIKQLKEQKRE
jgi:hypothetical protein